MPDFITSVPVASLVMATFVGASLLALYAAPWMIERGVFRPYWLLPQREWATPVTISIPQQLDSTRLRPGQLLYVIFNLPTAT